MHIHTHEYGRHHSGQTEKLHGNEYLTAQKSGIRKPAKAKAAASFKTIWCSLKLRGSLIKFEA